MKIVSRSAEGLNPGVWQVRAPVQQPHSALPHHVLHGQDQAHHGATIQRDGRHRLAPHERHLQAGGHPGRHDQDPGQP